jgi:hypothetical protein
LTIEKFVKEKKWDSLHCDLCDPQQAGAVDSQGLSILKDILNSSRYGF